MNTVQHAIAAISALAPLIVSATMGHERSNLATLPADQSPTSRVNPSLWQAVLAVRAQSIRDLKPGWDGHRSVVPTADTLANSYRLAFNALDGNVSATSPYLVPAGDGSIQLEWHEAHGELELLVDPGGELSIWIRLHQSDIEFEGEGEEALALFYRWAPWLAASHSDAPDAPLQTANAVFQLAA